MAPFVRYAFKPTTSQFARFFHGSNEAMKLPDTALLDTPGGVFL